MDSGGCVKWFLELEYIWGRRAELQDGKMVVGLREPETHAFKVHKMHQCPQRIGLGPQRGHVAEDSPLRPCLFKIGNKI